MMLIIAMLTVSGCAKAGNDAAQNGPQQIPTISKEQLDKVGPETTYDDLVKLIGTDVRPIKSDDRKTYEFKVDGEKDLYADLTFDKNGKLSEKNIFRKLDNSKQSG